MQCVTCGLFSNSFSSCLHLLNGMWWVGAVYIIFLGSPKGHIFKDSSPVNMVDRTTHTWSALEISSMEHGYQTRHAESPLSHLTYVRMYTVLLGNCCVHMPSSLNDKNDFIFQLLQVPYVCYGALHKVQPSKPLVADCTPHSAFCISTTLGFESHRTSCSACSQTHWSGNGLHHQTTGSLRWRGTIAQTSRCPDRICFLCLLVAVVICTTWIL